MDKKTIIITDKGKKKPISFRNACIIGFAITISYVLFITILKDDLTLRAALNDMIFPVINLFAVLGLFYAAKHSKIYKRRTYLAWTFLAVAQMSFMVGDVIWAILEVGLHQQPFPSIADIFYFSYYIIFVIGIFLLPRHSLTSNKQFKIIIDTAIIMISVALIFWTFLIVPTLSGNKENLLSMSLSLAYIVLDFVLLFTLFNLILVKIDKTNKNPLLLLAASITLQITADIVFTYQSLHGTYISGSLTDVGWVVGYVLIGLAGLLQANNSKISFQLIPGKKYSKHDKPNWTVYLLPLGAGSAYILLIWEINQGSAITVPILEISVGIIIFLIFIRQMISLTENRQLYIAAENEILKRGEIEKILVKNEQKYRSIFETAPNLIISVDNDFNVIACNNQIQKVLGYTKSEIIGKSMNKLICTDCLIEVQEFFKNLTTSNFTYNNEYKLIKKDGTVIDVLINATSLKHNNKSYSKTICIIEDITDRKYAENEIKASLKEKEVLLQEIHHRVKNNLQIISSLMNLQSDKIQDKDAVDVFKESQNRIKSMALIHENLYQSKDLYRINFEEYVQRVVYGLFSSYGVSRKLISLNIDIKDVFLNIDTAIPCGLIINELVSNSLKHAFPATYSHKFTNDPSTHSAIKHSRSTNESLTGPNKERNEINIAVYSNNGKYVLQISDNGTGFPKDLNFKNTETLGLRLVNSLVQQLNGTLKLERNDKTEFTITIKELKYQKHV